MTTSSLSRGLLFETERFDYKSELPEEYNAGNRFYGKDVAEFLSQGLTGLGTGIDFIDEDWGWLVFSPDEADPSYEIGIYNLSEHRSGGQPGVNKWGLWVRAYEDKKLLGFIPRRVEVPVPGKLMLQITGVLKPLGVEVEPWEDGPH